MFDHQFLAWNELENGISPPQLGWVFRGVDVLWSRPAPSPAPPPPPPSPETTSGAVGAGPNL